jgi:UDP-glucose 4-epimerase
VRVLVTGGAGFIGSHLVDALLDRGDSVTVLDDLSSGRRANLEAAIGRGAKLTTGSLVDRRLAQQLVAEFAPQRVFHLAAQVDVRKAVADPAADALINIVGTINLLEAVRRHAAEAPLLFVSTGGAMYGEGQGRPLPFDESAPPQPESAYGASKLAAESYLRLFRSLHSSPNLALRLGNVYGPRQDPHGEAGVVAIFCGRLREGRPLVAFGDGLQTRDYVYVADVVGALLAGEDAIARGNAGLDGPFNVGTGRETTVLELAAAVGAAAGVEPVIEHEPARLGELRNTSLDPTLAATELRWRASTGLEDGIRETYDALAPAV